jgi:beta-galactosidase/beta-glucuronidase
MRDTIDLTGTWTFHLDFRREGEKLDWFAPSLDDIRWRQVLVPCAFEDCAPEIGFYGGTGWLRRRVRVPENWRGRHVAIRFEGSYYHTQV